MGKDWLFWLKFLKTHISLIPGGILLIIVPVVRNWSKCMDLDFLFLFGLDVLVTCKRF